MTADLFALLAQASLDVSAAVLVVLALRRPVRRWAGAALAYRLWLLVPLAAVAVALPSPPKALSLLPRPAPQAVAATASAGPASVATQDASAAMAAIPPGPAPSTPSLQSVRPLAVVLWGLGLAGFLAMVLLRQRRYLRALGPLTPQPGAKRAFLSASNAIGPALVGTLRAFVVLPTDFNRLYDDRERALILAHEHTHLAQRHHLDGALGVLLLALQWFNPLAYLAYRRFRIDQELACDAAVMVAHPRARAAYAEAMLKSQISGAAAPFACQWPMAKEHPFKERLTMLRSKAPTRLRRGLAGAALTLLLTTGAYVAYAAAPVEPERLTTVTGLESLPGEVAGVVGSGDQLRLQLKVDGQPRTLNVGSEYKDGWTLKGLTNTMATLTKGSQTRMVGLNPTGDVDAQAPSAGRSQVTVLGLLTPEQQATLQAEIDSGRWDGRPAWGMSQDETNRLIAYDDQNSDALTSWYAKNWVAGVAAMDISTRPTPVEIFGSDLEDRQKLAAARNAYRDAHYAEEMAMPLPGPSSIYIPAGTKVNDAMVAVGASPAGVWTYSVADDKGGRTLTRTDSPVYDTSLNQAGAAMSMANRGTPKK